MNASHSQTANNNSVDYKGRKKTLNFLLSTFILVICINNVNSQTIVGEWTNNGTGVTMNRPRTQQVLYNFQITQGKSQNLLVTGDGSFEKHAIHPMTSNSEYFTSNSEKYYSFNQYTKKITFFEKIGSKKYQKCNIYGKFEYGFITIYTESRKTSSGKFYSGEIVERIYGGR